jgi:hypothetical protein
MALRVISSIFILSLSSPYLYRKLKNWFYKKGPGSGRLSLFSYPLSRESIGLNHMVGTALG